MIDALLFYAYHDGSLLSSINMSDDTIGSILQSAKRFFGGTMLSRIAGMMRDIAMAFAFGAHASVAAFLVAFRFSHLLRRLLGEGPMQSALIPQIEKLRQEDPQKAASFFRNLTASLTALLSCIVVATMVVLGGVLLWIDLTPGNAEIIQLTLLMMPSLLFICLFGINASLLQCQKSYFIPSVAPVAFNLVWIFGAFCLWNLASTTAMLWLTVFVNLACIAQWAITFPQIRQNLKTLGGDVKGPLKFFSKDVLTLLQPLSLGVIGVGAAQVNNALDAVFARYADSEGPAYLWYAIRLQQLPLALFGIAISGAILPPLARAIKNGNVLQFRHFLDFALRRTMVLMLPISLAILALGGSGVNLLYGHGDFDRLATTETTLCLWAYGIGLLPMGLVLIIAPSFYAQQDYRTPTYASLISIFLNIFLNFILVAFLNLGAASVALATGISSWVNLWILSMKLKQSFNLSSQTKSLFGKIALASVCSFAIVWMFSNLILLDNSLELLLKGNQPDWPREPIEQMKILCIQTGLFFSSLFGIGYLLNAEELLKFHKSNTSFASKQN